MLNKPEILSNVVPSSPTSKFKSFSKDLDHNISQDYIRKQLYSYGILQNHLRGAYGAPNSTALSLIAANRLNRSFTNKSKQHGDPLNNFNHPRTTQIIFKDVEGRIVPSLRAPFATSTFHTRSTELQPQPRWPKEVEAVECNFNFIQSHDSNPLNFSQPEKPTEPPKIYTDSDKHVVYRYNSGTSKIRYFTKSRAGPSHSLEDTPNRIFAYHENSLRFEARFESGNLRKALQVSDYGYELYLQQDLYTNKHTQWYFFRVQNMLPGQKYRITIMNLMKPASLYNEGMKPIFYSERLAQEKNIGWTPWGSEVYYYKNNLTYKISQKSSKERNYYSLTWTFEFPYSNDTCYFAHCYPYTYTDLQVYLHQIKNCPHKSKICKQKVLCSSLAGNTVHVLTITNPSSTPDELKSKRAVVVSARVHPGETNSSFMMKGLIDFLTDTNNTVANNLRNLFVFKIVPMLNPDGVIIGNYRCSLSACDLNRQYNKISNMKDYFPVIYHLRQLMRKVSQERDIVVYCDLHGHSRKQNIFMYGCEDLSNLEKCKIFENSTSQNLNSMSNLIDCTENNDQGSVSFNAKNRLKLMQARIFPMMLSKRAPHLFSYDYSRFKIQKYKEGCGRIAIWKEFKVVNSFTMEASFCGSRLGKLANCYFRPPELEEMGRLFCSTLLDYYDSDFQKRDQMTLDLENNMRDQILLKLEKSGRTIPPGYDPLKEMDLIAEISDLDSDSDGGSDSSVSDGVPPQCTAHIKVKKSKKRKSKRNRRKRKKKSHPENDPNDQRIAKTNIVFPQTTTYRGSNGRVVKKTKPVPHIPALSKKKEYSSYGSGLADASGDGSDAQHNIHLLKFKNRNGGIPVFSEERVVERLTKKKIIPQSPSRGICLSMPNMQGKKWSSDNEPSPQDYLRNIPQPMSRRVQYCSKKTSNSISLPSHLNKLSKTVQLFPLNKAVDDGYQSDIESDNYTKDSPLIISKVPSSLIYSGFTSHCIANHLTEEKLFSNLNNNYINRDYGSNDLTQALWLNSFTNKLEANPQSMFYTSFISEQKLSGKTNEPLISNSIKHRLSANPFEHLNNTPKPHQKTIRINSNNNNSNKSKKQSDYTISEKIAEVENNRLNDIRNDINNLFENTYKMEKNEVNNFSLPSPFKNPIVPSSFSEEKLKSSKYSPSPNKTILPKFLSNTSSPNTNSNPIIPSSQLKLPLDDKINLSSSFTASPTTITESPNMPFIPKNTSLTSSKLDIATSNSNSKINSQSPRSPQLQETSLLQVKDRAKISPNTNNIIEPIPNTLITTTEVPPVLLSHSNKTNIAVDKQKTKTALYSKNSLTAIETIPNTNTEFDNKVSRTSHYFSNNQPNKGTTVSAYNVVPPPKSKLSSHITSKYNSTVEKTTSLQNGPVNSHQNEVPSRNTAAKNIYITMPSAKSNNNSEIYPYTTPPFKKTLVYCLSPSPRSLRKTPSPTKKLRNN